MSTMFRDTGSIDAMPSQIELPSRVFGQSLGNTNFRPGLLSQDSSRLNMQFGSTNNIDNMSTHRLRSSMFQSTALRTRSFGLQLGNSSSHLSIIPEGSFSQEIHHRSSMTSAISKPFWPAVRNTTLTTGLKMQDSVRYNDDIVDNDGFRRPSAMRIIRGRNPTYSSRIFQSQNTDKHYRDLSNINGFNVSHISRRGMDVMSDSRLPVSMRSNYLENQSLSGTVISAASMKAQFMNVLENLHHSILGIGPHLPAEAVRVEFERAKQRLENISEMSFAPTVKGADTASVVSQSSKYIFPPINGEPTASNTLEGGSFQLKPTNDLLKTLISSKNNYKRTFDLSTHQEEIEKKAEGEKTSAKAEESDDEEVTSLVYKKPKPDISRKKTPRMKIKAPPLTKKLPQKGVKLVINLKQWYPIAVGSDLAFCGLDERGTSVKTDAVKKRVNNRKVELITGTDCNLIGSPSTMVLPESIVTRLKNGLTDRWRVLQKELLSCQTTEEGTKKRKAKSPKVKTPPKKNPRASGDSKRPAVVSTPKKKPVVDGRTRSGRAVKPPGMFWLANGSNEVSSTLELSEATVVESSKRKTRKSAEGSPAKKVIKRKSVSPMKRYKKVKSPQKSEESPSRNAKASAVSSPRKNTRARGESPNKKHKKESPNEKHKKDSPTRKGKVATSPVKSKTAGNEHSSRKCKRKSPKVKSPKEKKEESKEEVVVHSSTEDAKRQNKNRYQRGKRKREAATDSDSVQAKKSKVEKKPELEVESTVECIESVAKGGKKTKTGLTLSYHSPKSKGRKASAAKTKKETVKKKSTVAVESHNETSDFAEFEKNFEFKLDDIEIPEIGMISGNPQLSRSQLRLVSMETPPLKYFSSNLKLLGSTTPMRSPDWCISQRTESEVKQFERRREEAFKKRIKTTTQKTAIPKKNGQNKDVKKVMEWVSEKTVRSPQWTSEVLQYVIPSRKQREQQEDDEDVETESF